MEKRKFVPEQEIIKKITEIEQLTEKTGYDFVSANLMDAGAGDPFSQREVLFQAEKEI